MPPSTQIIIRGLTKDGRTFRPSDWAERLSGVLSTFGADHRMSYSPYVRPMTIEGVKCVVVDRKLEEIEPRAYRFLLGFAQDNDLQTLEASPEEATLPRASDASR
ncbi:MAG: DUF3579 domain-containing protein [Betaproteobacteria bacterium]|nr:DUF3579 domain-containing protein [Betaproteobacteria bacterium]